MLTHTRIEEPLDRFLAGRAGLPVPLSTPAFVLARSRRRPEFTVGCGAHAPTQR